jgi:hypothetical protein
LIVGTILNLINQGDALFGGGHPNLIKIILTYAVPYRVATYGAVSYRLKVAQTSLCTRGGPLDTARFCDPRTSPETSIRASDQILLRSGDKSRRTGGYVIDFWGLGYDIAERIGLADDINRAGYHMREIGLSTAEANV